MDTDTPVPDDLITFTEAAELMKFRGPNPVSAVSKIVERGRLPTYPPADELHGRGFYPSRTRMLSRRDVEALAAERHARIKANYDAVVR